MVSVEPAAIEDVALQFSPYRATPLELPAINATADSRGRPNNVTPEVSWSAAALEELMALGGGIGAVIHRRDSDLYHRMRIQDAAVIALLLVSYAVTLALSASIAYHHAANNSPVTFFTNPREEPPLAMEGSSLEVFAETFSRPSKNVQLQVTGFLPSGSGALGDVVWGSRAYDVAFTFALDLAPWVEAEGDASATAAHDSEGSQDERSGPRPLVRGIGAVELLRLQEFLAHDQNDLATVKLVKVVSWANWEELATNIKHRIRQSGFRGVITVSRTEEESVTVYKNRQWTNFMHCRTLKTLCGLSIIGWMFYVPYMWLRCTTLPVRALFRVSIDISDYWAIIEPSLTEHGFDAPAPAQAMADPSEHDDEARSVQGELMALEAYMVSM